MCELLDDELDAELLPREYPPGEALPLLDGRSPELVLADGDARSVLLEDRPCACRPLPLPVGSPPRVYPRPFTARPSEVDFSRMIGTPG